MLSPLSAMCNVLKLIPLPVLHFSILFSLCLFLHRSIGARYLFDILTAFFQCRDRLGNLMSRIVYRIAHAIQIKLYNNPSIECPFCWFTMLSVSWYSEHPRKWFVMSSKRVVRDINKQGYPYLSLNQCLNILQSKNLYWQSGGEYGSP